MTHFTRGNWRAREPRTRYDLAPAGVVGIALHWPGMATPLRTVEQVNAALRSWQTYHMDAKGWSDIAYQVAVDQAGNSYVLRGHQHRSGANGDDSLNREYGALLLVVAQGETPSPALIKATQQQVARHRHIYPHSTKIVGHRDIRPEPTACPGDLIGRLIKQGRFEPVAAKPTKEATR